ncbi:MAG: hypothetical protein Q7K20_01055 [Polaromonas sp.]|nr:hypothetical protein [Polaromonas sp.]
MAADQFSMFEPRGKDLASLASFHLRTFEHEFKVAGNLAMSGFAAASKSRDDMANAAFDRALVCEMALQFELLAGLV